MTTIDERARAKINLTLRVLGRRADGYHLLESLIAFADVADAVTFTPGAARAVRMMGKYAAIAGDNLVDTALDRIAAADPQARLGRVEVEKRLPIAAGIGGGSADAAAVLRAVHRANPAASIDWRSIAASLGADVPVCLAGRTSLVWGTGERIQPAGKLPRLDAVLVCPLSASPFGKTKSVFGQLSVPRAAEAAAPASLPSFADAPALVDYMRAIGNDLRAPAQTVLPDSAAAEAVLTALPDCLYVSLSGAGPTSYGIFGDARHAATAAEQLRARHPDWWVVATTIGD